MKKSDLPLYRKQLDAFRKSEYASSRELLAFARKEPTAPLEGAVLSSCLLIFDAEKFYPNGAPLRKRKTRNTVEHVTAHKHPLKAWEEYENALADILLVDGKWLNSTQTFNNGEVEVKFNPLPLATDEIATVPLEHEESLEGFASRNTTLEQLTGETSVELQLTVIEKITETDNVTLSKVDEADVNVEIEDSHAEKPHTHFESSSSFKVGKAYVAAEELTIDNSAALDDNMLEKNKEEATSEESNIFGGNVKGIKTSKEYTAPAESIIDNTIHDEHIAIIIPDTNSFTDPESVEVHTVDEEINVETNLEIHDKEYVAPEELTIDNSIDVSKIIINPKKDKKRFDKFRNKPKVTDYASIEDSLDAETKEYVSDKSFSELNSIENKEEVLEYEIIPAHVDERTLAEANEYHVESETDFKLNSKEYVAPEELTIDNSIPKAAVVEDSEDSIIVETVEKAIGSETEIRIKNKEYVAPEELTIDNSIVDDKVKEKKRRKGIFRRKEDASDEPVSVQPAFFLPQKPIDFEMPVEAEQTFVYKPKNRITEESIFETFKDSKKETNEETQTVQEEENSIVEEELEERNNVYIKDTATPEATIADIAIDYEALSRELAQEKQAHVANVSVDYTEEEHQSDDDNDEPEDSYSAKLREDRIAKLGFDASAIIKDIKIIDN